MSSRAEPRDTAGRAEQDSDGTSASQCHFFQDLFTSSFASEPPEDGYQWTERDVREIYGVPDSDYGSDDGYATSTGSAAGLYKAAGEEEHAGSGPQTPNDPVDADAHQPAPPQPSRITTPPKAHSPSNGYDPRLTKETLLLVFYHVFNQSRFKRHQHEDLLPLRLVSKTWNKVIVSEPAFWKALSLDLGSPHMYRKFQMFEKRANAKSTVHSGQASAHESTADPTWTSSAGLEEIFILMDSATCSPEEIWKRTQEILKTLRGSEDASVRKLTLDIRGMQRTLFMSLVSVLAETYRTSQGVFPWLQSFQLHWGDISGFPMDRNIFDFFDSLETLRITASRPPDEQQPKEPAAPKVHDFVRIENSTELTASLLQEYHFQKLPPPRTSTSSSSCTDSSASARTDAATALARTFDQVGFERAIKAYNKAVARCQDFRLQEQFGWDWLFDPSKLVALSQHSKSPVSMLADINLQGVHLKPLLEFPQEGFPFLSQLCLQRCKLGRNLWRLLALAPCLEELCIDDFVRDEYELEEWLPDEAINDALAVDSNFAQRIRGQGSTEGSDPTSGSSTLSTVSDGDDQYNDLPLVELRFDDSPGTSSTDSASCQTSSVSSLVKEVGDHLSEESVFARYRHLSGAGQIDLMCNPEDLLQTEAFLVAEGDDGERESADEDLSPTWHRFADKDLQTQLEIKEASFPEKLRLPPVLSLAVAKRDIFAVQTHWLHTAKVKQFRHKCFVGSVGIIGYDSAYEWQELLARRDAAECQAETQAQRPPLIDYGAVHRAVATDYDAAIQRIPKPITLTSLKRLLLSGEATPPVWTNIDDSDYRTDPENASVKLPTPNLLAPNLTVVQLRKGADSSSTVIESGLEDVTRKAYTPLRTWNQKRFSGHLLLPSECDLSDLEQALQEGRALPGHLTDAEFIATEVPRHAMLQCHRDENILKAIRRKWYEGQKYLNREGRVSQEFLVALQKGLCHPMPLPPSSTVLACTSPYITDLDLSHSHVENHAFMQSTLFLKNLRRLTLRGTTGLARSGLESLSTACHKLETIDLRDGGYNLNAHTVAHLISKMRQATEGEHRISSVKVDDPDRFWRDMGTAKYDNLRRGWEYLDFLGLIADEQVETWREARQAGRAFSTRKMKQVDRAATQARP